MIQLLLDFVYCIIMFVRLRFSASNQRSCSKCVKALCTDAYNRTFGADTTSTIDPDEIARFSRLSSEWWNEFGPMMPLHSMNSVRVPWISKTIAPIVKGKEEIVVDDVGGKNDMTEKTSGAPLLSDASKPLRGNSILDVGCGAGILSEPLARLGARVVGIDPSVENIEVAKLHAERDPGLSGNLEYLPFTLERIPITFKESFDAVVASEVLEHVSSRESFIPSVVELVKPGGHVFLTTLNRTWLSRILAIWMAERILKVVPAGIHDWSKFTSPLDVQLILEREGCSVRQIFGLAYNPFNNRWSWIKDTSINYGVHAVKGSL